MAVLLNSLLTRFRKILSHGIAQKERIVEVIEEKTGIELNPIDIDVRDGVVYLKIDPVIKSEIFITKEEILKQLNTSQNILLRDIR